MNGSGKRISVLFARLSIGLAIALALNAQADDRGPFALELASENVSEQARPALEKFLSEAEAALPPTLKQGVGRKITVQFTALDSTSEFLAPACNGEAQSSSQGSEGESSGDGVMQVRGRVETRWYSTEARVSTILLNRVMIPEILKGADARTYPCGHQNLYRLALATLVHELSHVYDFTNLETPERARQLSDCELRDENQGTFDCEDKFTQHPRVVSGTSTFRNLMNWNASENRNILRVRSPDPYEFKSPEESFAVNMEYFLLDPEYACRRRVEFDYFKDHFGFDPFPARACALNAKLELSSEAIGDSGKAIDLDPTRIYQIHYLLASQGEQLMSRFGHAMFRIIVCNASRKEVGPACMNDIADHVVVSFRANQGDWSVDAWKGLTGKYPSQMFLYPFYPGIVNEYTLDEPRDLLSVPLKLSEAEKARFVARVAETYWDYQGRYYFFTNNCATEALHLLKGVIRDFGLQDVNVMTPIGLYAALGELGLIDTALEDDRDQAMKRGYLFPSTHFIFRQSFAKIQEADPGLVPFSDLDDFSRNSDPAQRKAIYLALKSRTGGAPQGLANHFFILESYLFRNARRDFMAKLGNLLGDSPENEMSARLHRVMELQKLASPLSSSLTGYGIPTESDLRIAAQAGADSANPAREAEEKRLYGEVMDWAKQQMSSRSDRLAQLAANRDFFLNELRKKH